MAKRRKVRKRRLWTATVDEIKAKKNACKSGDGGPNKKFLEDWETFAGGLEYFKGHYPANKKSGALSRAELLEYWRQFYLQNNLGPSRALVCHILAPRLGMCSQNVNKILQIARMPEAVRSILRRTHLEDDGDKLLYLARIKDGAAQLREAQHLVGKGKAARKKPAAPPEQQSLPHMEVEEKTEPPTTRVQHLTLQEFRAIIREEVAGVLSRVTMRTPSLMESVFGHVPADAVPPPMAAPRVVAPKVAAPKVVPISKARHVYRSLAHWNKEKSGDCRKEDQLPPRCRYWHTVGRKIGIYPPPNKIWGERHSEVNKVTGKTETSWWLSKRFYDVTKKYVGHYWSENLRLTREGFAPSTAHTRASAAALSTLQSDIKTGMLKILKSELDPS